MATAKVSAVEAGAGGWMSREGSILVEKTEVWLAAVPTSDVVAAGVRAEGMWGEGSRGAIGRVAVGKTTEATAGTRTADTDAGGGAGRDGREKIRMAVVRPVVGEIEDISAEAEPVGVRAKGETLGDRREMVGKA